MSTKAAKPKSRQLSPRFLEAIMAPGANIGINQALETNDIMSYIDVKNIYIYKCLSKFNFPCVVH